LGRENERSSITCDVPLFIFLARRKNVSLSEVSAAVVIGIGNPSMAYFFSFLPETKRYFYYFYLLII